MKTGYHGLLSPLVDSGSLDLKIETDFRMAEQTYKEALFRVEAWRTTCIYSKAKI